MKTVIFRLLFMLPKMNQPRKTVRITPEQWESRRDKIQQLLSESDYGSFIKYILRNIFEKGVFEPSYHQLARRLRKWYLSGAIKYPWETPWETPQIPPNPSWIGNLPQNSPNPMDGNLLETAPKDGDLASLDIIFGNHMAQVTPSDRGNLGGLCQCQKPCL